MRVHSNRKLHSLLRPLQYGDQNGYGKRLEEEAEDQEGKSGEKKKAQGETLEEVASQYARAGMFCEKEKNMGMEMTEEEHKRWHREHEEITLGDYKARDVSV